MPLIQLSDAHLDLIRETLTLDAESPAFDKPLTRRIYAALRGMKEVEPVVIVQVFRGCVDDAVYANVPMNVVIVDYDVENSSGTPIMVPQGPRTAKSPAFISEHIPAVHPRRVKQICNLQP